MPWSQPHIGWKPHVLRHTCVQKTRVRKCICVCVCVSILPLQSINGTRLCMLSVVIWPFVQSFQRKHKESIESVANGIYCYFLSCSKQDFFPLLKDFSSKPWDRCKNRIKHKSIFWLNSVLWSWRRPKWEYSTFFVITLAGNQDKMKRSWCVGVTLLYTAPVYPHQWFKAICVSQNVALTRARALQLDNVSNTCFTWRAASAMI